MSVFSVIVSRYYISVGDYIVVFFIFFFFFKQKTAYEMRISDWSSDVCSSDLEGRTWHRDSGTVGRSRRFAFTGHVSHRRVGALVGRSTGHEVVSHGSGFGDRGQSGKTPPSCSALRWLQDVGGSPLACLGVAVVMTNDHDFDRDEITQRNVKAVVKWFNATKGFRSEEHTSEL